MGHGKYILDAEGEPKEVYDLIAWAKWFETAGSQRQFASTQVSEDVRVSTVFLGLDHAFGSSPPILWETMIFGGEHDGYEDRYSTKTEAEAGHAKAVELARSST